MLKSRFLRNRVIVVLIALTVVLFLTFDLIAQIMIQSEFDERARDSIKFQARETAEVLKDLEDGMDLIDESYELNAKIELKSHVDITLALIDGLRGAQSTAVTQVDTLRRIDAYRKNIDGTIAVYSLDKGMLLYPDGDNGRINIYFNAENKALLDKAMKEGQLYGSIHTSDLLQGEAVLSGYFAYDREWRWLIFAVQNDDLGAKYRTYGERITIKDGIERAQSYSIVESAFVLDPYYFYEYGAPPEWIGRKISLIDIRTNKNLSELYENNINQFVQYVVKNSKTGKTEEKLAYVLKTDDGLHHVVVEADLTKYEKLISEVVVKIRIMTLIAIIALILILYLLYQNFVTLIDPIAEQSGGQA